MISRRRFLSIAAAASGIAISPKSFANDTSTWRGHAFGSEISIQLSGASNRRDAALNAALDTIRRMETYFSIYNPTSLLSRLNRAGTLRMPPEFARLINQVDYVHQITDGLFDPTIQPLFTAQLKSNELSTDYEELVRDFIGWDKVEIDGADIRFPKKGMAITLNGIAQGFATDRVSEVLEAHGFTSTRVNIGEYRANDTTMKLNLHGYNSEPNSTIHITDGALATSEVNGFTFPDGSGHILSPSGQKPLGQWSKVSVHADTGTMADGISTALVLSPDDILARELLNQKNVRSIIMQSADGGVVRL